jgi:hypothetical protein
MSVLKMVRNRIVLKTVAVFLLVNITTQVIAPSAAFALTNGPSSPEFSAFEPVATTEMVNLFSGDFTYNLPVLDIPGPDGAGYSMSLSYHSGTSPEEEASWVGYGWTLNPGTINRDMRGFPDDYNKVPVTYYNKTRPNWSVGAIKEAGIEFFGKNDKSLFGLSANSSLRFNNYMGYQRSKGIGLSIMGMLSITYSAQVNPIGILNRFDKDHKDRKDKPVAKERESLKKRALYKISNRSLGAINSGLSSGYGMFSFNSSPRATSFTPYKGISVNYHLIRRVNPGPVPIGLQAGSRGNFNLQYNNAETSKNVNGFMNNLSSSGQNVLTDYFVEGGDSYSKRDYYLGIPFNSADNFSVTGEGLSGGFRFYPLSNGHYYPDQGESKTKIFQAGLEIAIGWNLGIGVEVGLGTQKLKMENWKNRGNTDLWKFATPNGFFRFNNDLGGEIEYSSNTNTETSSVLQQGSFPGFKDASINTPTSIYKTANNTSTLSSIGRSSFIDYRTNLQLSTGVAALNRTANISDLIHRSSPQEDLKSGIAEIGILNESSTHYIYGLPVYTRNEANFQFGIQDASIVDNYIAHQNVAFAGDVFTPDLLKHEVVVGEVKKTPYANNYLLTQILTPDYVDVGNNGISEDDFGGWTEFKYQKILGTSSSNWYRYRSPYSGLYYQRNSISDKKDDVGSVSSGEKEVYYLKSVETKTHIAFFVTNKATTVRYPTGYNASYLQGSGNARLDGQGASKSLVSGNEKASRDRGAASRGTEELEYLEKIVLFSKARPDKPVKVTRFSYSNNLVGNLPNNKNGVYPNSKQNAQSGKLTLEKVWFEYEGVVNSRISPYIFKYEYKDKDELTSNNEDHLLALYPDFSSLLSKYTKNSQNPDYAPHLLDPWGNTQNFGKEQQIKGRSWIYQGPDKQSGAKSFDPAAWQLKQIKLPSGGEILVEYEQKDYRFVHDRPSMGMASLVSVNDSYENPSYIVNTEDLNVTTIQDRDELIRMINEYFGNGKDKMFFKFLYALQGSIAALDYCKSDYIDGYAKLVTVEPAGSGSLNIKITLEGKTITGSSGLRQNSPRQACYDFVANQRIGKADDDVGNGCVTALEESFDDQIRAHAEGRGMSDAEVKLALAPKVINAVFLNLTSDKYKIPNKSSVCKIMNTELSYLKLPLPHAKKGGGVRVKRLYMLDHGLETGDAALYGSEYIYENEDGKSSGVATNEPLSSRIENPLVSFLPKKDQKLFDRLTSGIELDQTEGPLGESLLPAASVGHARVVVRNIHTGSTGTGFAINDFFTVKDYPFDKAYDNLGLEADVTGNSVDATSLEDNQVTDRLNIPAVLFDYSVDKVWASQGFRFIINSMHGQVKKMATYGGDYNDLGTGKTYLSSLQEYSYFQPGEKVKVLRPDGTYSLETPGKEMDIAMEMKSMHDNSMDFSIELDISITINIVPPVFFTVWPGFQLSDNRISTHSTSKVLRYPAIIKNVLSYKDGVYNLTEHLAFNGSNGQPILVKNHDGYDKLKINGATHDGAVYSLSIPAWWKYPTMGQKSTSVANTNRLDAITATFTTYGTSGNLLNTSNQTWLTNITKSNNILSASVQTFSTGATANVPTWYNAPVTSFYSGITGTNLTNLAKIWRPHETYVYRTETTSSNGSTGEDKIYNGGFFKDFTMFTWNTTGKPTAQTDNNWIKVNQVTKYSPHGSALEERDVLGIYKAVKYDYSFGNSKNLLPVMMATNGEYGSIAFNSFETTGVKTFAHAGERSLQHTASTTPLISGLTSTNQLKAKGALIKLWLKTTYQDEPQLPELLVGTARTTMSKVSKTGDWTLYSGKIDKSVLPAVGSAVSISFAYVLRPSEEIYIDDVRFQPSDAESICYVYDVATFKPVAQFDDQHFGLYFQYNAEGKLVRKLIETERGLKTLQETQYNTQKTVRPLN